ncbi:MAG: sigma-70 family RNA polymerase sigma factor [Rhodobiaceae bacterium]|nr:sigma-70 family RNA polymerase sigma factor [Rhodobiaceae bacterium]
MQDEDDAIMIRIAGGDRAALGLLMNRHAPRLTMVARRFLGSADEADDVIQDVFFAVWQKAGRYRPGGAASAATWLTRIAVNRCIDRHRAHRFRRWVGLDAAPEAADPAADPERTVAARSTLERVCGEILNLPARQRMALLLASSGDADAETIAETMEISRGAAEQLIVRARRSLRAAMAADDNDAGPAQAEPAPPEVRR